MPSRFQIKRAFLSGKFSILKSPSHQKLFYGEWTKRGTHLEIKDLTQKVLATAIKKAPSGIHLAWKQKYEISFPETKIKAELSCTPPLKNSWEAVIGDKVYQLNSPLRKAVEIYVDDVMILKEVEEDTFWLKSEEKLPMISAMTLYLCIRQQHSDGAAAL